MTANQVCRDYAKRNVKITIKMLDTDEDDNGKFVLVEGSSEALEFLGNLLLAQAAETDCGNFLGPNTAGKVFFTPESTLGVYIHRLPCEHKADGI